MKKVIRKSSNIVRVVCLMLIMGQAHAGVFSESSMKSSWWKSKNKRIAPVVENITLYSKEHEHSEKKLARKGVLVRFKQAKATIVIAHGYMCNKFDIAFLRNLFPYGQFNFLTFDFRAHGQDTEGQICTLGRDESFDVIAAGRFIRSHPDLQGKPLFAYAFSMGAVATIEAQAKDPSLFDAMILDCPFDSSENVIKNCLDSVKMSVFGYQFHIPGRSILQRYAFHPYVQSLVKLLLRPVTNMDLRPVDTRAYPVFPAQSIAKVTIPCFFIHCKKDEKIPVNAGKSMYLAANGPKMLWLTNGRSHYDSYFYNPEKYIENVRGFFDQVLKGQWKSAQENRIVEDPEEEVKA